MRRRSMRPPCVTGMNIAPVRRSQKDAAEALGADGVVALDDEADYRHLPTLDGIADTIGASTTEKLIDRVRPGGVIASVASDPKGAQELGIVVRHHWAHPDPERLAALVPRRGRGSPRHSDREAPSARADPRSAAARRTWIGGKGDRPGLRRVTARRQPTTDVKDLLTLRRRKYRQPAASSSATSLSVSARPAAATFSSR
jgi:hypothetical protein